MKPIELNDQLYEELGLLYENTYIASQLSDDPSTGQLDADAYFDGKDRCWQTLSNHTIQNKKTIIVLNWYFEYLDTETQKEWIRFFGDLLDDGFNLYTPGDNCLIKLSDKTLLSTQLNNFTPMTKETALSLAARQQLSREQIDIINLQRLRSLGEVLSTKSGNHYELLPKYALSKNSHLSLPSTLTEQRIQQIDALIEPNDQLHYNITGTPVGALTDKLQHQINYLSLNIPYSTDDQTLTSIYSKLPALFATASNLTILAISSARDITPTLLKLEHGQLNNLTQLYIESGTIDGLFALLCAAPNLEEIIMDCWQGANTELSVFKPIQLRKLIKLAMCNSTIPMEQLIEIITAAPHLKSLDIDEGDGLDATFPSLIAQKLHHLTNLRFRGSSITMEQLAEILTANPNLKDLSLVSCENLGQAQLTLQPRQLPHLIRLTVSSPLTIEQCKSIFTAAPNLTRLNMRMCPDPGLFLLNLTSDQLSQITELDFSYTNITRKQLNYILVSMPNLTTLKLAYCEKIAQKPLALEPGKLSQLTTLDVSSTMLTHDQMLSILTASANLTLLNVSGNKKAIFGLLQLKPGQLKQLTELDLSRTDVTMEQLTLILATLPNLTKLSLYRCMDLGPTSLNLKPSQLSQLTELNISGTEITWKQLAAFRIVAPNLRKTKTSDCDHLRISHAQQDELFPDGRLMSDPNELLQARVLFKTHQQKQPYPNHYHLACYEWKSEASILKVHTPKALETTQLFNCHYLNLVEDAFNTHVTFNSPHHFYAQINLETLKANTWYQLPALSTRDKLLIYAITLDDYEIKRDSELGYYYLRTAQDVPRCTLNYIIESPSTPVQKESASQPALLALIKKLVFNEQGQLVHNEAYTELTKQTKNDLIAALTTFCHFQDESAANISDTGFKLLNQLIQLQAGVCRHRATLFVALASALGIKAFQITNDIHRFVIILDDHQQHRTIDLGGGTEGCLEQLPMPRLASTNDYSVGQPGTTPILESLSRHFNESAMATSESVSALPETGLKPSPSTQLPEDNPFETWNSLPLQAQTTESLAQELLAETNTLSRRLIIMPQGGPAIEALHDAVCREEDLYFFTPNLDNLGLKGLKTSEGQYERVDTPLAAFLHQAQQQSEKKFTWFINWSNSKAEHVGLNSIIDDVDRHLGDIMLPPNLHIIAVMDSNSAANMGEDFYSRFDGVSQAPTMSTLSQKQMSEGELIPITPQDALISTAAEWKKVLFGYHHINGKQLDFIPGKLIEAIKNQSPVLRIHNAPWENPEFRWAMSELMQHRRFYANGRWYELPETLQIDCVQSDYQYPALEKAPTDTHEFILNQRTYAHFFPHHRVSSEGNIESRPGFLKSNSALKLRVTENLSQAQWFQLWQNAFDNQCQITIQCTPNVIIPEALKPWMVESATLVPKDPIALIISKDIDYGQAQCSKAAHIIPVSPNTRFETLFCHVHRHEQGFISEETKLLQAIRSGESIVFKGKFSEELAQRLQTLFTKDPSLYINGEYIPIKSAITLISDNSTPFATIQSQTINYDPEIDLQKLDVPLQNSLKALYQSLAITPRHSHFINLPDNPKQHEQWLQTLSQQLRLAAGQSSHPPQATEPRDVLEYLATHPFVFLLSETGEGKSYFIQRILPEFAKQTGHPISIHHGMDSIKTWLEADGVAYLFFDEVNLTLEQFTLLDNIAHGERVIWIDGQPYPLSPDKKIIFAGNPKQYEGRLEADLFRRFPYYLEFKGQPLRLILEPLLKLFESPEQLLPIIEHYYRKAIDAGLNMTPRNAQMMCLTAFTLKQLPMTSNMPEFFLMQYAVLNEIQHLATDITLTQPLQQELEKKELWAHYQETINAALSPELPTGSDYIWTESRQKLAMSIQLLLAIREQKVSGEIDQATGVNALFLEGEAGLGKSQLLKALLQARNIPYIIIDIGKPQIMRRQLIDAFHEGKVAIIDEPNSFPDEQLLNALLSGVDLDGSPAKTPGFFLLGAQNPITYPGRKPPSKAYANRVITLQLEHYAPPELKLIIEQKFSVHSEVAQLLTTQYTQAREHAKTQKLFPSPNPRAFFKQAQIEQNKIDDVDETPARADGQLKKKK